MDDEQERRSRLLLPSQSGCLTLVWAALDLYIAHATNGIEFTRLDRQRLERVR